MAVRCGNIDDVDIGVSDKLGVRSVQLRGRRTIDLLDKRAGPFARGGRSDSDDLVADVVDVSDGGVGEKILAEVYDIGSVGVLLLSSNYARSAIQPVAKIPHLRV